MTHTQTVMLRLLTMCIPFRNLRKKWRTFLRDFLSDYDRDARRSMRAWRRHPVAGRTILILEPNYCHGEVIPGFCRHLLDMGYRVDVLMHHSLARQSPLCCFKENEIQIFTAMCTSWKRLAKAPVLNRYEAILVSTSAFYDTPGWAGFLHMTGLDRFTNLLAVEHELNDIPRFGEEGLERQGRLLTLGSFPKGTMVNPHFFGEIPPAPRNREPVFITVGSLSAQRKNHNLLIEALQTIYHEGHRDFSVIVPIYNMESLLPRCLDSLAAQTLRDLEIICVDDGSTDGSGGIVRKYASGDSRFRLITQENSGRAEARNAGIRAAAAPYLGFADPDDYVEPDMYERLYRLAEESGADMVQCSYSPFLPAESGESRGMAEEKLLHIENTACDGVFTEKGEIFRLFLEDRITGVVWSKLFRRLLPGCSAPLEVRLPSSFTSGEDTLYVSRAIARCRSVALTSEKLYHYGLGGPQSVSSRNRKAETRPASYYAVFEMLTREKLREGVLGSNRTAYMNYIVPLLFPDNEMPAGRLRHWAELWREADITSEHVYGMPREQRAYLEAALAGRWIYLRLLQCFWKFKTARRKMFRLRFSKNGIDTLQILGYTLYSAKKLPRSSL